jgi:transposase-like protein
METQRRGADGRRIFSPEFKREHIGRGLRKELTVAALSRELNVEQSVVRRWKHLVDRVCPAAVAANEEVVPTGTGVLP